MELETNRNVDELYSLVQPVENNQMPLIQTNQVVAQMNQVSYSQTSQTQPQATQLFPEMINSQNQSIQVSSNMNSSYQDMQISSVVTNSPSQNMQASAPLLMTNPSQDIQASAPILMTNTSQDVQASAPFIMNDSNQNLQAPTVMFNDSTQNIQASPDMTGCNQNTRPILYVVNTSNQSIQGLPLQLDNSSQNNQYILKVLNPPPVSQFTNISNGPKTHQVIPVSAKDVLTHENINTVNEDVPMDVQIELDSDSTVIKQEDFHFEDLNEVQSTSTDSNRLFNTIRGRNQQKSSSSDALHKVRAKRIRRPPSRLIDTVTLSDDVVDPSSTSSSSLDRLCDLSQPSTSNEIGINSYLEDMDFNEPSTSTGKRSKTSLDHLTDEEKYRRIRQQNNYASKRSREKKKRSVSVLKRSIPDLEEQNKNLRNAVQELEDTLKKMKYWMGILMKYQIPSKK